MHYQDQFYWRWCWCITKTSFIEDDADALPRPVLLKMMLMHYQDQFYWRWCWCITKTSFIEDDADALPRWVLSQQVLTDYQDQFYYSWCWQITKTSFITAGADVATIRFMTDCADPCWKYDKAIVASIKGNFHPFKMLNDKLWGLLDSRLWTCTLLCISRPHNLISMNYDPGKRL